MPVTNAGYEGEHGPLTDVLRLQSEFQLRMAEETMRYLRAVQNALSPVVPTSVLQVSSDEEIRADGVAGGHVTVEAELENRQAAHVTATAGLTPLTGEKGTTWFATAHASPSLVLIPPGERATVRLEVVVPPELPAGDYRGALLLLGFRSDGVPVRITVNEAPERERKADATKTPQKKAEKPAEAPEATSS